jgi:hypothetical protein
MLQYTQAHKPPHLCHASNEASDANISSQHSTTQHYESIQAVELTVANTQQQQQQQQCQ